MKLRCVIMKVDEFAPDHTGLILQPLLEDCPPFPYPIHNPVYKYQTGQYLDVEVSDIITKFVTYMEEFKSKNNEDLR